MTRDPPLAEQQHRDLEEVARLQDGIVTDVPLLEPGPDLGQDAFHHRAHLTAEPAVRFAQEDERMQGRAQDAVRGAGEGVPAGSGTGRFRRVATPAPATTRTIAIWTSRPGRSGETPIHGIPGRGPGRGSPHPP